MAVLKRDMRSQQTRALPAPLPALRYAHFPSFTRAHALHECLQKAPRQSLCFHAHAHSLKRVRISLKTFEITHLCFQYHAHSFSVRPLFSYSYEKDTPIHSPAPSPHHKSFRISAFQAGPFRSNCAFVALFPLKLSRVIARAEAVEWVFHE